MAMDILLKLVNGTLAYVISKVEQDKTRASMISRKGEDLAILYLASRSNRRTTK
jgi:hypothetical protein